MLRIVGVMSSTKGELQWICLCIYSMLRIVGVMSDLLQGAFLMAVLYLFDAQNRWGYELARSTSALKVNFFVYLFDAQNRWGYETLSTRYHMSWTCIYSMLRIVGVMRSTTFFKEDYYERVSIRCSESLGL